MSKVRIELTGHGRGKVFIDDVQINGVRTIDFEAGVREANHLVLGILADEVEVVSDETDVEFEEQETPKKGDECTTIGDDTVRYRMN